MTKQLWKCFWLFVCLLLLAGILGCGNTASKKTPDNASINGDVYSNAFFAFSWRIPKGWSVADREQFEATQQTGRQMLSGGDKKVESVLRASEKNTYQLLMTSERPLGAPVEVNPSVIIMAEKVTHMPGIKTGEDYLFHAKKLLSMGQMPVTIAKDVRACEIGGRPFHRLDVTLSVPTGKLEQAYLAAIIDGYALAFIVSDSTVQDLVPNRLKNLQFSKKPTG